MRIEFRKYGVFLVFAIIMLITVGLIASGSKSPSPVSKVEETVSQDEDQEPQDYFIDSMGQKLSAREISIQAEQGDPEKQFIVGWCYDYGLGGYQDFNDAAEWYEKSVRQGNSKAAVMLGYLYYWGQGVKKNQVKAVELWKQALPKLEAEAQIGDPYAMLILSWMLRQPELGKLDLKRSDELVQKVAEMGDPVSCGNLGLRYLSGENTELSRDPAEGIRLLEKAGNMGDVEASVTLWISYFKGLQGLPKDLPKSIEWAEKAADRGHLESMKFLCSQYLKGEGISQDVDKALDWYSRILKANGDDMLFPGGAIRFSHLPEYNEYDQLEYIIRFYNENDQMTKLDSPEMFEKPSWQMIWSIANGMYPYAVTFSGYFIDKENNTRKILILFTVYPKKGTNILEVKHLFDGDTEPRPGLPVWVERELEE